jgi:excisionase family DNA binding protein
MNDRDELLDIGEAAELLNVSETSLRRWTNSGRLPCLRVGGRRERRFRRADLLAFMEEGPVEIPGGRGYAPAPEVGKAENGGEPLTGRGHLCSLYSSDEARAAQAAAFLADGLRSGSVCFFVYPPDLREKTLGLLAQSYDDLETAMAGQRLLRSEYASTAGGQLRQIELQFRAAMAEGARSLRLVADVWVLAERLTRQGLIEYEAGYERLTRRYPVASLCQYDVRWFSALDLVQALKGHQDIFRYPTELLLA